MPSNYPQNPSIHLTNPVSLSSLSPDEFKKPTNKQIKQEKVFKAKERRPRKIDFKKVLKKNIKKAKYPGAAPIDPELVEKHSRGSASVNKFVKTNILKEKIRRKEANYEFATEQAARTEILLKEDEGYIEPDDEERTVDYTQEEIRANVDITAASKGFELNLDFGPYRLDYTRNGRHLLLGGRRGHVASFDWLTKRLNCEINVMEEVRDVTWLHLETMFAVAQKSWVYVYDRKGTELHCLKNLYNVNRLEFLPYHFLLVGGSDTGFLSWLDVSVGQIVAGYHCKVAALRMMCQNPTNAAICVGDSKGVVSMWAPSQKESLAKVLCHSTPLTALTVDPKGQYMATAGTDRKVKVWDLRELSEPLYTYKTRTIPGELRFSQRGALAMSLGNIVEIYKKPTADTQTPYLRQKFTSPVSDMEFVPYEDLLGAGHNNGFASLIVPGSGEPNFDARETNPYHSLSQRREHEVHALLEKLPMELISLDPNQVASVDVPSLKDRLEAKRKLMFVKVPKLDFQPRHKMKGKGGGANMAKNKQIVREEHRRKHNQEMKEVRDEIIQEHREKNEEEEAADYIPLTKATVGKSVLDRFADKPRRKVEGGK